VECATFLLGCLLGCKGVAVGAGGNGGVLFVCADLNFVKGAVILTLGVVLALGNGAFNAFVCVCGRGAARRVFHEKTSFRL